VTEDWAMVSHNTVARYYILGAMEYALRAAAKPNYGLGGYDMRITALTINGENGSDLDTGADETILDSCEVNDVFLSAGNDTGDTAITAGCIRGRNYSVILTGKFSDHYTSGETRYLIVGGVWSSSQNILLYHSGW